MECEGTFEEVCSRLIAVVPKHKFGIIGSIDFKAKLQEKGIDFGKKCIVYEVCNPQIANKMLMMDLSISTMLPCRISVYEEEGKIKLATTLPASIVQMFPKLENVPDVKVVEDALKTILDESSKP